jgi:hypothetical protein
MQIIRTNTLQVHWINNLEVTPFSLFVPGGSPHTLIQSAVDAAAKLKGTVKSGAVWIPADYIGSDTYTNVNNVPVFDMRGSGTFSGGSLPGGASTSVQYNNAGVLGGTSLKFTPSHPCSQIGTVNCDDYTLPSSNICLSGQQAADAAFSFGNYFIFCSLSGNNGALANGGAAFLTFAQSKLPSLSAYGMQTGASAVGTNTTTVGALIVASDDPLDVGTGQTIRGLWVAPSLTRASGSVTTLESVFLASPNNYSTSGTVAAETVTNQYGIHIQDLLAKGTTRTAAIQIDAQTTGANAYAIKVDGGLTSLASIAVSSVASLTTTAATSDNLTVTGMTSSGHCSLTATNASAATNTATTYISAKTTNQITVTHAVVSGMTYDVFCTAN